MPDIGVVKFFSNSFISNVDLPLFENSIPLLLKKLSTLTKWKINSYINKTIEVIVNIKPKTNLIAERLKMMQGNDPTKKEENKPECKISGQKEIKDEKEKTKEDKDKGNNVQSMIKNLSSKDSQNKTEEEKKISEKDLNRKDESTKPNTEIKNKFAERIKAMQGGINTKKEEKKEEPVCIYHIETVNI